MAPAEPAAPAGDPSVLGLPIFVAGYVTFAFAALGIYLLLSAASAATGGKAYPLGRPLVR